MASNLIIIPSTEDQKIVVKGDADLRAGNIKKDVEIFKVTGTYEGGAGIALIAAAVPDTGQRTSYSLGDDGDLRAGVTWPTSRFTDNGDGTVSDNLTRLVWLKNANCPGRRNWQSALSDVAQLNADGTMNGKASGDTSNNGSHQSDWRLPNLRELLSLMDSEQYDPALPEGHPFTDVRSKNYWSSSTYKNDPQQAWRIGLLDGEADYSLKSDRRYVWPVRGGR